MISGSSAHSAQLPLGIVADFSQILAQSAIIASMSTVLLYNFPNTQLSMKYAPSFTGKESSQNSSPSLQLRQSFEIRCITDGFEFSDDSVVTTIHGDAVPYRQCEALREMALGIL